MADLAASTSSLVRVNLAPALVRLFPDAVARVEVAASDVAGVVAALDLRWPGMGHMLCDERPAVRRHINVFVGGARAQLDTALPPGSELSIFTAVSGG
jgi:sulfur-carrier protein